MTVFLRILEADVGDKAEALRKAVSSLHDVGKEDDNFQAAFQREPAVFKEVPGSPFAYWASDAIRGVFSRFAPLEHDDRTAKQGLATADDFRFVRMWWEVPESKTWTRWVPFAKGGKYSPFYADVYLLVNWEQDGAEVRTFCKPGSNKPASRPQNTELYLRPGLTWPLRTQSGFGLRVLPANSVFGHKGPSAFLKDDEPSSLLALLAVATSKAFRYLVDLQMAFGSYEVGVIQRTPIPDLAEKDREALATLAARAWSLKRSLDTMNETSHAFVLPPGRNEKMTGLNPAVAERELADIRREIDDRAFDLYGIGPEDRATIEAAIGTVSENNFEEEYEWEDEAPADKMTSWLFGVAFGRFDIRLVTGERPIPSEPEPFDPLPARATGMWPENESPDASRPDMFVDDEGHKHDIAAQVAALVTVSGFGVPTNLREWIAKEVFPDHVKMYSKSGPGARPDRKAPIYWQLATPSASYSVWLYIHNFTKDTLYKVLNDYVAPKLAHEERKLSSFTQEAGANPAASQRKEIAAQQDFVDELRAFRDEVARAAPLWNPDLDDGVIINFAPLWRLVPQHKAWQKECKACWDKLAKGDYDWSHLAMHLWPERVVPKCAEDRSLAIAHGLEDTFWEEDAKGKWHPRKPGGDKPRPYKADGQATMESLIAERTSTAVKSALESLQKAPAPAKTKARPRKKPTRKTATRTKTPA